MTQDETQGMAARTDATGNGTNGGPIIGPAQSLVRCSDAGPRGVLVMGFALAAALVLGACGAPAVGQAVGQATAPTVVAHTFGRSLFAPAEDRHWGLPKRLTEISGLAVTRDGRLLGHADEKAVVSEINLDTGEIVKSFSVGDPAEPGDFEGIAVGEQDAVYLITSAGLLYRFMEGVDGAHVPFQTFDTGLGPICEVEGLAYHPAQRNLILACKVNHARPMKKTVALYAWSVRTHALMARPWLTASAPAVAVAAGVDGFHPSSVEIDPATGRIILLAAREGALAELNPDGSIVAARKLDASHNQAEGSAILANGALVIADEGGSGLRGGISRYPRAHD